METTPSFHYLLSAISGASHLVRGLPDYDIPDERTDLILRSYTFLCHAAFEEYLESVSLFILRQSVMMYEANGLIGDPIFAASAYYKVPFSSGNYHHKHAGNFQLTMVELLALVLRLHEDSIRENHGIRTTNQDRIFLPIGVRLNDADRVLSQMFESFGVHRGELAHRFRIQTKASKSVLTNNVSTMLSLTQNLDQSLNSRLTLTFAH